MALHKEYSINPYMYWYANFIDKHMEWKIPSLMSIISIVLFSLKAVVVVQY